MFKDHEKIFAQVAFRTGYWIFVRLTNKESLRYVNLDGYVPKRIDCKAKTADFNSKKGIWQLAGLVVDHRVHSDVFKPEKIDSAKKAWGDFERGVLIVTCLLPRRERRIPCRCCRTVSRRSPHMGR